MQPWSVVLNVGFLDYHTYHVKSRSSVWLICCTFLSSVTIILNSSTAALSANYKYKLCGIRHIDTWWPLIQPHRLSSKYDWCMINFEMLFTYVFFSIIFHIYLMTCFYFRWRILEIRQSVMQRVPLSFTSYIQHQHTQTIISFNPSKSRLS